MSFEYNIHGARIMGHVCNMVLNERINTYTFKSSIFFLSESHE